MNTKYQDNLEKIVSKHYEKTNFRDPKESVLEIKTMFAEGLKNRNTKMSKSMVGSQGELDMKGEHVISQNSS